MKKLLLIVSIFITTTLMAQQPCSDLLFSEYIEGTSFNKAIEIFNPTTTVIDLSFYEVNLFSNGSATPTSSFALTGMLNPNDVFVIANPQADPAILAIADATSGVINFNGDDAFQLYNPFQVYAVDVIGQIGSQPSSGSWPVDTGTTANHTLVRKDVIQMGDTSWITGATGWDAYGVNDFSHLGSHSFISCLVSQDPDLYFTLLNYNANENAGTLTFDVGISNSNAASTSVDVSLGTGTATLNQDFSFSPTTITFAPFAVSPQTFTITITDDAITEPTESIKLLLSNATNNATISQDTMHISILDNDNVTTPPSVKFDSIPLSYNENAGTIQLSVSITNPNAIATTVDLGLNAPGTTATPVQDFSFSAGMLTFPANSSTPQVVTVPIVDDATNEPTETISFKLSNPTNNATITGSTTKTVSIVDNDPNSVAPIKTNEFYFYPNPAQNVLHLANAGGVGKAEIANLMGQVLKTFNTGGSPTTDLDVNDLSAGMYFLNIYSVSGVKTYKLRIN